MKRLGLMAVGMLLIAVPAFAADTGKVEVRGSIDDGSTTVQDSGVITKVFTAKVRQQQSVTLTANANTVISVPTSAEAVIIDVGSVRSLQLRVKAGDSAISLDSTCPIVLPISADAVAFSIFNANTNGQQVRLYWM